MKCKDCANYECPNRGDGERECVYINGPYRFFGTPTMPFFDWQSFRAEAAKDILCAMINHFGTSNIDMNDVVKWADSLISKLKEKEIEL